MGKLSLYSLHFLDPSQSEVTERACMLKLIQESQKRLKFEIEDIKKKKKNITKLMLWNPG